MVTLSLLTLQLARAYGVVILIIALSALTTPQRLSASLADFQRSPGLTFLGALFAVVLGVVLIMLHSIWVDVPAGLVSLLGWAILIKGIVLFAIPDALLKLGASAVASPRNVRIWGVVALILAIVYLVIGFGARAEVSL